jgi:hypothetical protein
MEQANGASWIKQADRVELYMLDLDMLMRV